MEVFRCILRSKSKQYIFTTKKTQKENMIYGESLDFKDLIGRIEELQSRFRTI